MSLHHAKPVPLIAASLLCLSLAACTASADAAGTTGPSVTTSPTSPSPSASAPAPAPASVAMTKGQQRVLDANEKLSSSLFAMTAAARQVKDSTQLTAPRQALQNALGAARTSVTNERRAAYGTVRVCSSVLANASSARAAAARATAAASAIPPITAKMRSQVSLLQTSTATVSADLVALKSALAAEPHPPATVSATDVEAALTAARTAASTALALASSTDGKTAAAASGAVKLSAQASSIASSTC